MALVDYETEAGVALLTLTDPPVKGYTHEMMKDFDAAILDARFDNDLHVLIITGHGEKYFCAGANINMLEQGLALERDLQAELFATDDARQGLDAFVEKRKAQFRGR